MPPFVVLLHESPGGLHWDFMLQRGSVLATWALPGAPDSAHPMTAEALPDHRLSYLGYEGPISGDRGSVTRWDRGTCRVERRSDTEWIVIVSGERLKGRVTLTRLSPGSSQWQFSFVPRGEPEDSRSS